MTVQMVSEVLARADAPELYDFARPMKLAREHAIELTAGGESFARSWHTELSMKLRANCRITVIDVAMMSYDDYVARIPTSAAMVLCSIEGMQARGVLQLPLGDALGWVARMVGGTGLRDIPERQFSPVELAVVTRTMRTALELMRYSYGALFPEQVAVESIRYSSRSAKAAAPSDPMIVTTFELIVDDVRSTLTLAIPAEAMTRQSPELGDAERPDPAELMLAQLETVPVRVSLRFQETQVRPDAVLGLAVGDLIRMTHSKNRPLDLVVDGQVMARAAVGASGSQLACVIVDTHQNKTGTEAS